MRPLIKWINYQGYESVASCCGHSKYKMTIVVKFVHGGVPIYKELLSDTILRGQRKFYKKDKQGHYYIPEVINER